MKLSVLIILSLGFLSVSTSCKKKTYLCECKDPANPNKGSVIHTIHARSKTKASNDCQNMPIVRGDVCAVQ